MLETASVNDRKRAIQVALVLLAAIVIEILGVRNLVAGRIGGRSPLHLLNMLTIAAFSFGSLLHFKQMLLRVAFTLIGAQAATRVLLTYIYTPSGWLHIVNLAGTMLELLAVLVVMFEIVRWLNCVLRSQPSSGFRNTSS